MKQLKPLLVFIIVILILVFMAIGITKGIVESDMPMWLKVFLLR